MKNENIFRSEKIAVACIDILGYSDFSTDQQESILREINDLIKKPTFFDKPHVKIFREPRLFFGDSIYLFGNESESLEGQIIFLASICNLIIYKGIFNLINNAPNNRHPYACRVGINVGDIRDVALDGFFGNPIIGQGIVRSHALQSCQNWIGGAVVLSEEYEGILSNSAFVQTNLTFIKNECKCKEKILALNWPIIFGRYWHLPDQIEEIICLLDDHKNQFEDEKIKIKWKNTVEFVKNQLNSYFGSRPNSPQLC